MGEINKPATTLAAARWRCLTEILKPDARMRPSDFGYVGFPDSRFRSPQGAAFASAKLRHAMYEDGVIAPYHSLRGTWTGEYRITEKGREEVAHNISMEAS